MFAQFLSYTESVLMVLLLFGGTVFVHELGHFLTAMAFGLRIDAFAIGMGPALWQKRCKGVVYKICLLPIGGYVALPQLDITGSAFENEDAKAGILEPVAPWKRIIIAVAGPLMNILAALLLCGIVWMQGRPTDAGAGPAVIQEVEKDSPAYVAGLRDGDRIVQVNDDPITFWADFRIAAMLNQRLDLKVDRAGELVSLRNIPTEVGPLGYLDLPGLYPQGEPIAYVTIGDVSPDSAASAAGLQKGDRLVSVDGIPIDDPAVMRDGVQAAAGKSVDLVVKRGSQTLSMALTPEWNGEVERYLIGIFMQGMTYPEPLTQIRYFQGSIFRTLKAFARPKEASRAAQGVGGPVMILSGMHSQVRFHPMQALWFTALINVNLAIINLLPLIILDGGHIMVALFEWITGRRPHRGLIIGLANVMVVVLITLMVFLSLRDVFLLRRLYSEVEPVSTPQVQAPSTEPPPETTDE